MNTTTNTNSHLIDLERDLEADLAEARRQLGLGRDDAIAELNAHRGTLGELCRDGVTEIESLAHDADEDLKKVRARLGELNLILAEEKIADLETFDHFRDRILHAMTAAEEDLALLKARGDAWSAREGEISEAWNQFARRLELVRLHLVHETEVALSEFETEQAELVAYLEKLEQEQADGAGAVRHSRGDLMAKLGKQFDRFVPGLKTIFLHPDSTVPPKRPGRPQD